MHRPRLYPLPAVVVCGLVTIPGTAAQTTPSSPPKVTLVERTSTSIKLNIEGSLPGGVVRAYMPGSENDPNRARQEALIPPLPDGTPSQDITLDNLAAGRAYALRIYDAMEQAQRFLVTGTGNLTVDTLSTRTLQSRRPPSTGNDGQTPKVEVMEREYTRLGVRVTNPPPGAALRLYARNKDLVVLNDKRELRAEVPLDPESGNDIDFSDLNPGQEYTIEMRDTHGQPIGGAVAPPTGGASPGESEKTRVDAPTMLSVKTLYTSPRRTTEITGGLRAVTNAGTGGGTGGTGDANSSSSGQFGLRQTTLWKGGAREQQLSGMINVVDATTVRGTRSNFALQLLDPQTQGRSALLRFQRLYGRPGGTRGGPVATIGFNNSNYEADLPVLGTNGQPQTDASGNVITETRNRNGNLFSGFMGLQLRTPISIQRDEDKNQSYSFGVELGVAARSLTGDIARDRRFRQTAFGTGIKTFGGFQGAVFLQFGDYQPFVRVTRFPGNVDGFGGWQTVFGLDVLTKLFTVSSTGQSVKSKPADTNGADTAGGVPAGSGSSGTGSAGDNTGTGGGNNDKTTSGVSTTMTASP